MAKSGIESRGLPQPGAVTQITEADRPRVYEMVRKELEDRLNGPSSYYPDGGRKGAQALSEDLGGFIGDMANARRFVDDPANLIDEIVSHLRTFANGFKNANKAVEDNDRRDPIQIPPEFFPETYDGGGDIGVDLDPERLVESPPDPRFIMQPTAYPGVLDLAGRGIQAGGAPHLPSSSLAPFGWNFYGTRPRSPWNGES